MSSFVAEKLRRAAHIVDNKSKIIVDSLPRNCYSIAMIAIANPDGSLKFVETDLRGNVITLDGVRYKAVGSVKHDGQHVGVYRASEVRTKHGNCPRCSGTGNYGELGVCFQCNGSGNYRKQRG